MDSKRPRDVDDVDTENQGDEKRIKVDSFQLQAPNYTCTEEQWKKHVEYLGDGLVNNLEIIDGKIEREIFERQKATRDQAKGTLQGPLHPLLQPHNFSAVNFDKRQLDKVLARMKPALALATKFLTNEIVCSKPWIHSQLGELKVDDETHRRYLKESPEETHEDAYKCFQEQLRQLKVVFIFAAVNSRGGAQVHGLHILPNEPVADHWYVREGSDVSGLNLLMKTHHTIAINAAYFEYYSKRFYTAADDLTTHVTLAVTLAHEIFHAFSAQVRGIVYNPKSTYEEPYFDLDQARTSSNGSKPTGPELGNALEKALLGVGVTGLITTKSGANMERSQTASARAGGVIEETDTLWLYTMGMDWSAQILTEPFWRKLKAAEELYMTPPDHIIVRTCEAGKLNDWGWEDLPKLKIVVEEATAKRLRKVGTPEEREARRKVLEKWNSIEDAAARSALEARIAGQRIGNRRQGAQVREDSAPTEMDLS
jgi:hypothetical protein